MSQPSFEQTQERALLADQWRTLSLFVFLFCALNEVAALALAKAGAFEMFLDVSSLLVGLLAQSFLFGHRFFTTNADRKLFGPRRFAMVFGGAFKEGLKVPTFFERAGKAFLWRAVLTTFAGAFFGYALINAQWFTFVMLVNIMLCASMMNAFDFWRPLVWSILFLLLAVVTHHGSASGSALLVVLVVGAELLTFAALQSHLDRRSATRGVDAPPSSPLKPAWGWFMPLALFVLVTVLVFPLMPGKRTPPLPKTHWAKRLCQGSAQGPSLSSLKKNGSSNGQGSGQGGESGAGNGQGEGDGRGEEGSGSFNPPQGGKNESPPNPEELAKTLEQLQRQSRSPGSQEGQSGEERETAQQGKNGAQDGSEQDIEPEQYKSKLQNLAKLGKSTADKLGGGAAKSAGPDKANAPATRKLPKLDLKRLLPIVALLLTIAGLVVMMLLKKKKNVAARVPKVPVISRAQQAAALRNLERQLEQYAGKTEGVSDHEVIETYHIFLEFLKDHETPRPQYATPDEFAVDVGFVIKRKEMQPLTRVFCSTLYGKRGPSREEFNEYLDNVREVAKAVHDEVRR